MGVYLVVDLLTPLCLSEQGRRVVERLTKSHVDPSAMSQAFWYASQAG